MAYGMGIRDSHLGARIAGRMQLDSPVITDQEGCPFLSAFGFQNDFSYTHRHRLVFIVIVQSVYVDVLMTLQLMAHAFFVVMTDSPSSSLCVK